MESTRPACIPPPVGFHVMKNLCRVEGEADLTMHICSTHMRTRINKRAPADARASLTFARSSGKRQQRRRCEALEGVGRHFPDFTDINLHSQQHQVEPKILLRNEGYVETTAA